MRIKFRSYSSFGLYEVLSLRTAPVVIERKESAPMFWGNSMRTKFQQKNFDKKMFWGNSMLTKFRQRKRCVSYLPLWGVGGQRELYIYIFQEVFTAQSYSHYKSMQVRVVSSIPLCTETNIVISCQVDYINRSQQKSLNLTFVQHLKCPTIGYYCSLILRWHSFGWGDMSLNLGT